jgi:c-di-AMP phosphodiesterase-like protein
MFGMSFISVRYNPYLSIGEFGVSLFALVIVVLMNIRFRRYIRGIVKSTFQSTENVDKIYLENFSFPVAVVGTHDDIVWCNSKFIVDISKGKDPVGCKVDAYSANRDLGDFIGEKPIKCQIGNKYYRVYGNAAKEATVLYYIDDTYYRAIEREFNNKKTSVAIILFDNAEDFDINSDGETQGEVLLAVDKVLQKWASDNNALCCKLSSMRYMMIFEDKILREIISNKFSVLEEIRQIKFEDKSATISIGIGRGKDTLRESEICARKALDMALGRGGDQVALSVDDDYEFFGGVSNGVEKRSKVRTRTFANNIKAAVKASSNVIIMGHNYSDLDCVGASVGLYSTIKKALNKDAYIACDINKSLARPLIDECMLNGMVDAFVSVDDALKKINDNTLLIIVDTHISSFLESQEIYNKCKKVIVIDHHRKMVNFISNALIFFHEPTASSASEMVSELIGYMGDYYLSRFEAEALLSGIMLDTKNFVVKTGVRTFEAAAYLKQKGADTIDVKRLFAGDIDEYKQKAIIVSGAKIIGFNAIAYAQDDIENPRVVSSQAADELLGVVGVHASFVIYRLNEESIGISARSYGKVNVQLIMEELGGGGHLTMAACQLNITDFEEAEKLLIKAIKKYEIGR